MIILAGENRPEDQRELLGFVSCKHYRAWDASRRQAE